jgi:hypothetical protein
MLCSRLPAVKILIDANMRAFMCPATPEGFTRRRDNLVLHGCHRIFGAFTKLLRLCPHEQRRRATFASSVPNGKSPDGNDLRSNGRERREKR